MYAFSELDSTSIYLNITQIYIIIDIAFVYIFRYHTVVTLDVAMTRNYHPNKFQSLIKSTTKEVFKHSFAPNTVRLWNSLPGETVSAPTLNVFRAHLATH